MSNLWISLNDRIPEYFNEISKKYDLKFVKLSSTSTALIGNNFALILSIDRFYVEIYYATNMNDNKEIFCCGNYFAERHTSQDRKNLLIPEGAENIIINNFKVINNGLMNRWGNVLYGDNVWLEEYKKSQWFSVGKLSNNEQKILWSCFN